MRDIYLVQRLLESFQVVDKIEKGEHEGYYLMIKHRSDLILRNRLIPVPPIHDPKTLIDYYMLEWDSIKRTTLDERARVVALFTLTRLFCKKFKRTDRPELIPLLGLAFSNCLSRQECSITISAILTTGFFALATYEVLVLSYTILKKAFLP